MKHKLLSVLEEKVVKSLSWERVNGQIKISHPRQKKIFEEGSQKKKIPRREMESNAMRQTH